ncbi:MAG: class I SAM-dependent methyltransferase [Patescibacteria group bacterium]|jgi:SAM-dependent methyltransferase
MKNSSNFLKEVYDKNYFNRYRKRPFLQQLFIKYIDRKEPVFSFLKKQKRSKSSLLDIGCGNGLFLQHAQHYFNCTGIDISQNGLNEAKRRAPKAHFQIKSIYDLDSLPAKKYDVITCFDVLEHVLVKPTTLDSIYRILKPDGIFVFSAPNPSSFGLQLKWDKWFGFSDPTHISFYSPLEWGLMVKKAGFIPMKTFYNGLMDPPYFPHIPNSVQNILIKYPSQILSLLGFPLPSCLGELFFYGMH